MRPSVFRLLGFHVRESKGFLSLSFFFCLFVCSPNYSRKKGGKIGDRGKFNPFRFFFFLFSRLIYRSVVSKFTFEVFVSFFFFFYEGFVEFLKCESE